MMFGMVGCGECIQAFSAAPVMPGRLAITSKLGALEFGDTPPAVTA
jgi:hypothetical protein